MSLEDRLGLVPDNPGVYLMKDDSGRVIYVGKAKNLRKRVRSYFQASRNLPPKVRVLVGEIADLEYIVTNSELEALILECNLIKKERPRYNIRLKDDKSYPYIKVTTNEEFPRIFMTRNFKRDGNRYFGPYTDVKSAREVLSLLKRIFPVRACKKSIKDGASERPCLNYHIERCLAPCAGYVDRETYASMVKEICLFLEGRGSKLVSSLKEKMNQAALDMQFEKAAAIRDQISAINSVIEKQRIVSDKLDDIDAIGFASKDGVTCVQVFFIREGKLIGREHYLLEEAEELTVWQILSEFIKHYYADAFFVPREILIVQESEDMALLEEWLSNLKGSKVSLHVPQRGEKKQIIDMVEENASIALEQEIAIQSLEKERTDGALFELAEVLELDGSLELIEGFDISNIQGTQAVGSMVVFEHGVSLKEDYRRFRIKTVVGPNDYAMMQEVLRRRYFRVFEDGLVPDLILIDGGRGQLNAALEVLDELKLEFIPVIALAEREEEIYVRNRAEPIKLPRSSRALQLLQRVRDEAHRFALSYHRSLRSKGITRSVLDEIPGIGPALKSALLKHFRSVDAIKEADTEQLIKVPGISKKKAQKIQEHFAD